MSRREIKRMGDDFALAVNRPDGICSKGVAIDSSKRLCNMKLRCAAPPQFKIASVVQRIPAALAMAAISAVAALPLCFPG